MSAASSAPLQAHLVSTLPSSIYYLTRFLSPSACDNLLAIIQSIRPQKWTNLSHRRLLSLPSPLTGRTRDTLLLSTPLPSYLIDEVLPRLEELGIFTDSPHGAPNHALVNEYLPGQGIMPHEDGPAYHPTTATVSLGSSTVLDVYSKSGSAIQASGQKHWRILQEPGSLLITTGECYANTLHGIADLEMDDDLGEETIANWALLGDQEQFRDGKNVRGTRFSLTYRDVRKVVKVGSGSKSNVLARR